MMDQYVTFGDLPRIAEHCKSSFYKNVKQKPPHRLPEESEGVMRWFVFLMLFRGFQLPQITVQKGVKAAHCLLPSGVAVQL